VKLEFDNLAVYAASIGVWMPISIVPWGVETWDESGATSFHCVVSDEAPPDDTGRFDCHEIGIPLEYDLTDTLKGLRHELEHARQVEELGYFEWYSSYGWYREILGASGPDPMAQYYWNPYEIEANAAADAEWRDLLPCVKGST
jgi:hypothetical protein